jgi:hypothetical protein
MFHVVTWVAVPVGGSAAAGSEAVAMASGASRAPVSSRDGPAPSVGPSVVDDLSRWAPA